MNKTAIKNFAIWARNKLIADISYRAGLMGITAEGIHAALPQSSGQTEFYDIGTAEPYSISGKAVYQRRHLAELIRRKEKDTDYKTAYKYIIEEVAYTWFNRLIAVRFMEVNDYLPSHIRVLSSDTGKLEPDLVTMPFDADLEFTREEQQAIIDLKDANKLDEVFRILFIKQCNALNEILPALFEKTDDYTELLLNLSIIDQDGVVYHLVHDIPEEDFDVERGGQVEIIGWLYQYYNTEPKNEAFAKKGKITKEEVPAVTQLFTPDWIVRYMVENSLGRLWVEGHPNDDLKAGWKYYLEEAEQEPEVQAQLEEIRKEYEQLNPEDIKIIDPCMGSGHILIYAFDVLMQIYESAGYGQRDAARSILENNLYGLDIDDRAFQLAYFAVMMKARQYNRRILNGEFKPSVYSIRESNGINRNQLNYFGSSLNEIEKNNAITQITRLLDTFRDAKEYGSILNVGQYDWILLDRFISDIEMIKQMSVYTIGLDDTAEKLRWLIKQGEILSQKYHIAITNPPYMSINNGDEKLSKYVRVNYPDSKTDLFSVFIEKCFSFLKEYGLQAMITMHAWMFLGSFENLRVKVLSRDFIAAAHLGSRAFEEISGEVVQTVCFIQRKSNLNRYIAGYSRLIDYSAAEKEKVYLQKKAEYYRSKKAFETISGNQIAYWISDEMLKCFSGTKTADYAKCCKGLDTGKNDLFLRLWFEVDMNNTTINNQNGRWVPYNKGGSFRKWYGNNYYLVDWADAGKKLRAFEGSNIRNMSYQMKLGITWSTTTGGGFSGRLSPKGHMFDSKGCMAFPYNEENIYTILAQMNSAPYDAFLAIITPTLDFNPGPVSSAPMVFVNDETISQLSKKCIRLSKDDWDQDEMSWDFIKNPLLSGDSIEEAFRNYSRENARRKESLIAIEEKINRFFVQKFGLGDECLKQEKSYGIVELNQNTAIRQLLSYAVGCIFGRYSLDKEGVIYTGSGWNDLNYQTFIPDLDNIVPITDEEYLEDDIVSRLCAWLKVAYGDGRLEKNLDYIAKALGNKGDSSREFIRNYFLNNFFKDHCQTYSVTGSGKRPIYWLFDSGKQNGFKALIYLHRYTPDIIGNLRIDYLHRMQRIYESEISRMQDMIDHNTNAREVAKATKRREKLTKQLKECREYDEKLAHLALSRIELDLDDGVKVNYRKLQTANDGKFYEVLADSKNIMAKK